jgi:hypothetical protein
VHCAQWGTWPRLLTVLAGGGRGLALDEDAAVHLDGDGARVAGHGPAGRRRRRGEDRHGVARGGSAALTGAR